MPMGSLAMSSLQALIVYHCDHVRAMFVVDFGVASKSSIVY
jgi:hypothetical protein